MFLYPSTAITATTIFALVSSGSCQLYNRTINLPATAPSNVSQKVDPSFPGFAFEQSSFYSYSFDEQGNPNSFSQNLVNSVLSRTGGTPLLRVGGTSGDHGIFNSTQKEPTNFPATKFKPQMKGGVTIGPSFFDAFKNWPGAKFEFMVPFRNTSHSHSWKWAEAGMDSIGIENLETLELGNEPNFYHWFSVSEYAKRYITLHDNLKQRIPSLNNKKIFQALDSAANFAEGLPTRGAFEKGLDKIASSIKQVAYHYYQGHGPKTLDQLQDWVRHSKTVNNMTTKFIPNIQYLRKNHEQIGFAFTETGYNVGGGKGTLDSNLATALWAVDFQLYCMTVGVKRVNWQQILMSSLNMWRAVASDAGPPVVTPNFYSQPFIADFISKGGQTQVAELDVGGDGRGTFIAYGAFESGKLARIALLNLHFWTPQDGSRPHVDFTLRSLPSTTKQVKAHHLSAPTGALAKEGLSYAGLQWTFESNGTDSRLKNDSLVLDVQGAEATVSVNATSAVLVVL
ncbi:hypothetical protein F5Y04DRAFT_286849 [Hypomontagnella monticulosa]|nr:hypothetical protein F5Y04DRAFT_286849 [Hypomontagnella monticulosa]